MRERERKSLRGKREVYEREPEMRERKRKKV